MTSGNFHSPLLPRAGEGNVDDAGNKLSRADASSTLGGAPPFFPGGTNGKESACNTEDSGFDPWIGKGKPPGDGNGNPLWSSCLEISTGREAWWAAVHGVAESRDATEQPKLSPFTLSFNKKTAFWRRT